ncbi:MAG: hypothetical protein DMG13_06590 [Acidobacteria bacterium]|nr:MAG: hypothetical protein DMG13_06590 [Acidobacteriota bacterium]
MRKNLKLNFLLALAAVLVIINPLSDARAVPQRITARITANPADQYEPAIWEDIVVWTDLRNGNGDIYAYDLDTKTERRITTDPAEESGPAIFRERIVYSSRRNGNYDIYLYNLSTNTERQITSTNEDELHPVIFGDLVGWTLYNSSHLPQDVYLLNLQTGELRKISTNAPDFTGRIDLFQARVMWADQHFAQLYNARTGETRQLSVPLVQSFDSPRYPAVDGRFAVWTGRPTGPYTSGSFEVALYDFSTNLTRLLTNDSVEQSKPAISGDRIVWVEDADMGDGDIILYDIDSGRTHRLTNDSFQQDDPAIWGRRVVYTDNRNGDRDIYLAVVPAF